MFASKRKQDRVYIALIGFILVLSAFIFLGHYTLSSSLSEIHLAERIALKKKVEPISSVADQPFLFKERSEDLNLARVIAKDLNVLTVNTRPDSFQMPFVLSLGVKGQEEVIKIKPGKRRNHLHYSGKKLEECDEETELYISFDRGSIKAAPSVFLHFDGDNNKSHARIKELLGPEPLIGFCGLEDAKFIGEDKLQAFYGSGSGERLYLSDEESGYFLELTKQGYFMHESGRWRKANPGDFSSKEAVFQVVNISSSGLDLWVWPCGDLRGRALHLDHFKEEPMAMGAEKLFENPKRRMKKAFSCRFDKKLAVFKVGDWLFEEKGRWHLVKTAGELDAIVSGKKTGSLIIFDSLTEDKEKKTVACKVFSPYRTCHEDFSIHLGKAVNTSKKNRRRPVRNVRKKVGGKAAT